jgi:hypothetical protein
MRVGALRSTRRSGDTSAAARTFLFVLDEFGGSDRMVVRAVGIEPTLLAEPDFESGASTSSATPAQANL